MSPAKKTRRTPVRTPAKRGRRKATPAQLRALAKARKMKALRARARAAPGGKGRIRNRPAARRLLGTPK